MHTHRCFKLTIQSDQMSRSLYALPERINWHQIEVLSLPRAHVDLSMQLLLVLTGNGIVNVGASTHNLHVAMVITRETIALDLGHSRKLPRVGITET